MPDNADTGRMTDDLRRILEAILADAQEALERVPERGSLRDTLAHVVFNAEAALRQIDGEAGG